MESKNRFYLGARVQVRSLKEIAASLDADGCLQLRVKNRVEKMILET